MIIHFTLYLKLVFQKQYPNNIKKILKQFSVLKNIKQFLNSTIKQTHNVLFLIICLYNYFLKHKK